MDKTVELWLVRHGQTAGNKNGTLVGWVDTPLTAEGEAQAKRLRPFLADKSFDSVWSSDLSRTVITGRLSYGEPVPDARLREIHFGDLENSRWDDMPEAQRDAILQFEGFAAPNGESLDAVKERLEGFIAELAPGRHLLFSHGGTIRTLTHPLGINRFVPNGTVVALNWTQQKVLFTHPPMDAW